MIKLRNQGDYVLTLRSPGTQTTNSGADVDCSAPVPFPCIIKAVYAILGTAGVTGTQTTDLLVNGSSLVSSGTMFSFATTSKACTYNTPTTNPPVLAKGDQLAINTTAVHSGTAAKDLSVAVTLERFVGTGFPSGIQTDTYGYDSDAI